VIHEDRNGPSGKEEQSVFQILLVGQLTETAKVLKGRTKS
jgi:hypothetical protein